MAFLDELARQLLTGGSGTMSAAQGEALIQTALQLLGTQDAQQGSGLAALVRALATSGLGNAADSWVGTGSNVPVSGPDLQRALERTNFGGMPQRAGVPPEQGYAALAQVLPRLVDRLTPNGNVAQQDVVHSMAQDLMRDSRAGLRPGAMEGMRMADKPKPDFSDVQSGGSSTAPKPAPPPQPTPPQPTPATPRTYAVVAGDSLSKIAKKFYGDAKKWRKIFEANKDIIKNPDLIQPGWKLKIPD